MNRISCMDNFLQKIDGGNWGHFDPFNYLEGVDQHGLLPDPVRVVLDHRPGQLDGHKLDLDPVDLGQVGRVVGSGHGVGQHRTGLRPYSRPLVTQFFSLTAFLKSNISALLY